MAKWAAVVVFIALVALTCDLVPLVEGKKPRRASHSDDEEDEDEEGGLLGGRNKPAVAPLPKGKAWSESTKTFPEKSLKDRGLLDRQGLSARMILENAALPSAESLTNRHQAQEVLGYITPWNSRGYEAALRWGPAKLTYVSPCWFIITHDVNSKNGWKFNGYHDVKKDWIASIREIEGLRLLPRVSFEGFSRDAWQALEGDQTAFESIVRHLYAIATEGGYDGLVLDAGGAPISPSLSRALNLAFKPGPGSDEPTLMLIVTASPHLPSEVLYTLSVYVDRINVMTYDASNAQNPGPSSPLGWTQQVLGGILAVAPVEERDRTRAKMLFGIPFYGNDFGSNGSGGPILCSQWLDTLRTAGVAAQDEGITLKLGWEEEGGEHYFRYVEPNGVNHEVWFPTPSYVNQRTALAVQARVAGYGIWELGQGCEWLWEEI